MQNCPQFICKTKPHSVGEGGSAGAAGAREALTHVVLQGGAREEQRALPAEAVQRSADQGFFVLQHWSIYKWIFGC
jgi:hypothetical protein